MTDPFLQFFNRLPLLDKPQHVRDTQARQKEAFKVQRAEAKKNTDVVISKSLDSLAEDTFSALSDVVTDKAKIKMTAILSLLHYFQDRGFAKDETLILPYELLKMGDHPFALNSVIRLLGGDTLAKQIRGLLCVMTLGDPKNIRHALYYASQGVDEEVKKGIIQLIDMMPDEVKTECFPEYQASLSLDDVVLHQQLLSFVPDEKDKADMMNFMFNKANGGLAFQALAQSNVVMSLGELNSPELQKPILEKALKSDDPDVRMMAFHEGLPLLKSAYQRQQLMLLAIKRTHNHQNFYQMIAGDLSVFQSDEEKATVMVAIASNWIVKQTHTQSDFNIHKKEVMRHVVPVLKSLYQQIADDELKVELLRWMRANSSDTIVTGMTIGLPKEMMMKPTAEEVNEDVYLSMIEGMMGEYY